MSKIRLLIVDDHNLFRQGLIRILADFDELKVVGEASNGREAIALVEQLRPDLVLMDLNMPVMSGPEAARLLSQRFPQIPLVMLTVSDRDEDLFDAIRSGARGYLLKNVQMNDLLAGIQRVHAGEAIIAPSMAMRLLQEFRSLAAQAPQETDESQIGELSEREVEVLRLVAQGLANKEIANQLDLSEHTVKSHLRNILEKLQLRSRAHAAAYAVQAGLVKEVYSKRF